MSQSTNHWKLGLFVVSGLAVALAALVFAGAKHFDRETFTVYMFFNEPVDGLSVGAEIRFRGIPVGRVEKINVAPDRVHIEVQAGIRVETLEKLGLKTSSQKPDPFHGRGKDIRALIERNPLTGMAVINSDFFDPKQYPPQKFPFQVPPYTLETVPSVFKGLLADLSRSLEKVPDTIEEVKSLIQHIDQTIESLNLHDVSGDLRRLMTTTNQAIRELDVDKLSEKSVAIQQELGETVKEIRSFVADLRKKDGTLMRTLATYEKLGRDLDQELTRARIDETVAAARRLMAAGERAGNTIALLGADVRQDLGTVLRTLEAVRRLSEMLERDPGSLLRGRTPTPSPIQRSK